MMPQRRQMHGRRGHLLTVSLLISVIALAFAGCSSSGGGTNYSLGLAGSTADHPSPPPTIPATSPGGTFAFVYDNQIWLRQDKQSQAKQLTQLVLSNGATLLWGPLIWSPSGKYIAFSLVENLTPGAPSRTSGPLYYVDTTPGLHFGETSLTGGSGSIYGHSYAWWDDNAIFYTSGSGVMLYDLGDCDPRIWQAISPFKNVGGTPTNYTGGNISFSDIAITQGNHLLATQITLTSPGHTGQVGTASIINYWLPSHVGYERARDASCVDDHTPQWLNEHIQNPNPFNNINIADTGSADGDLGIAYADPNGEIVTGAWQLTGNDTIAWQRISGVDTKAGIVSSNFCNGGNCSVLHGAEKYPIAAHPSLGINSNGSHIAFAADKLYVDNNGAIGAAGGNASPAWNGNVAVATQLVSQSTDAGGVLRIQTNLVVSSDGKTSAVLIAGAQDLSWKP